MKLKLLLLVGLVAAAPAFGSVVFTLSPGTITTSAGPNLVVFQGTIAYSGPLNSTVFLNDTAVTFTAPAGSFITVDPNFFFQNVPGTLTVDGTPADAVYTGPIFELFIAPGTPFAHYFGSIDILGGPNDPNDAGVLATQSFEVVVSPEPGALVLSLIGFLGVAASGLRRCVRSS